VALHFADVDDDDFARFVELPWEHLFLPQRLTGTGDIYFARNSKLAFVRVLEPQPEVKVTPRGKISVLVVAVKPLAQSANDPNNIAAGDLELIAGDLLHLGGELPDSLEVKLLQSPKAGQLMEELAVGDYDILHYVGFGRFHAGSDEIALAGAMDSTPDYVGTAKLAEYFDGCGVDLAVLQACRGSEAVSPDLAAFAAPLLRQGSKAVVAHQYPMGREHTRTFNQALYKALAQGTPVQMAAQSARGKVWSRVSESRVFLSPAVFMRTPGGLPLAPGGAAQSKRARVGAMSAYA
jgi:hypothetical protein